MNETNALKLTLPELDERIAREHGWILSQPEIIGVKRVCWIHTDGRVNWDEAPNYAGDMNLAVELLDEMPHSSVEKCYEGWSAWTQDSEGWDISGTHKNIAVAICLAWLQWKTGEVVEVVDAA